MAQKNPIQEAMDWYMRVVDQAIDEEKLPSGRYNQKGNITLMRDMIRESPKLAQIVIQFLHQSLKNSECTDPDTAKLHGTWLMAGYMLEYGKLERTSLMLKQMAPTFYQDALNIVKNE